MAKRERQGDVCDTIASITKPRYASSDTSRVKVGAVAA
jgi:hypothetical protein